MPLSKFFPSPADICEEIQDTSNNETVFTGHVLKMEVQPGLTAIGSDLVCRKAKDVDVVIGPGIICCVLLAGQAPLLNLNPGHRFHYTTAAPLLIGTNRLMEGRNSWALGNRVRGAGFILSNTYLDETRSGESGVELDALETLCRNDICDVSVPAMATLGLLAERALSHPYTGRMAKMFLEANTLSFVLTLADLVQARSHAAASGSMRHFDKVLEAQDVIDRDLTNPPSIREIARTVGINVTTLQTCFKEALGTTIFGYLRTRRLELARTLIRDHGLTISDASYRVGYAGTAAFTAAYRKHFGKTPGADSISVDL